jgi:hypothetical protein
VAVQLPQLEPPEVLPTFPEKAESWRRVRFERQEGQGGGVWSLIRQRSSKVSPHCWHLNS